MEPCFEHEENSLAVDLVNAAFEPLRVANIRPEEYQFSHGSVIQLWTFNINELMIHTFFITKYKCTQEKVILWNLKMA